MQKTASFAALGLALLFSSCSENDDAGGLKRGGVDLTRTVAIGNSLTAGMISGGWTYEMVNNSYPALIIKAAGGTVGDGSANEDFVVAGIVEPGVINPATVTQTRIAGTYSDGTQVFRYTTGGGGINLANLTATNINRTAAFNNVAVPGATARDNAAEITGVTATYGSPPFGNPLFSLVLRERAPGAEQAASLNPTFAFFWAGNNEILSSALSGAVTPTFPLEDNGSVKGFRSWHTQVMNTLLATGAKVVTATIPNVTVIPAVSMVGISTPKNERAYIADLDGNGQYTDTLAFWGTENGIVRKLRGTERVRMTWRGSEPETSGGRRYGLSQSDPLINNHWLSDAEIGALLTTLQQYNTYIRSWANHERVAVVDINELFDELAEQDGGAFILNGQTFEVDLSLPYGGFFSLDGVHPAEYGQKVLANAFIQAINEKFDGKLPPVSLVRPEMKLPPVPRGLPDAGKPASAPLQQWLDLLGIQ